MLSHLRRRVAETLAPVHNAMLSTCGPADIQAAEVACAARGLRLYMLLPLTSDLLFNLETHSLVVVSTPCWQVQGRARILGPDVWPPGLDLPANQTRWQALAVVDPTRVQIVAGPDGPETIDVDGDDANDL